MLLVGQRQQLQSHFAAVDPRDPHREGILLLSPFEQQPGVLPLQHLSVAVNFDPQPTVGIVVNGAGEQMAIFAGNCRRHAHFDTMRPADLLAFDRDRHRAAKNNQVVEHPDNTHPDGENFVFRAVHKAPDPHRDADQVEQHEVDIGPGNHPVDILLFHQSALRGDVEFAFMRINQRHKGGRRDIPGEHRLVDFTPERMAIFALNLRVGQAGVDHVRQHE